jgi:CHASE3 domain sensor protein
MPFKKTFRSLFQLRIIYVSTTIFLIVLSFFVFKEIERLTEYAHLVNHTTNVSLELERLIGTLKDAETGHRGYLLTHDSAFLSPFRKALTKYPEHLKNLQELTIDNEDQRKNLAEVERISLERSQYMLKILEIDKIRRPTATEILAGKSIMDELDEQVSIMTGIEDKLLNNRSYF